MWNVTILTDPLETLRKSHGIHHHHGNKTSFVAHATISISELMDQRSLTIFNQGGREALVTLADLAARQVLETSEEKLKLDIHNETATIQLESLDKALTKSRRRKKGSSNKIVYAPYVLERTDFWCSAENDNSKIELNVMIRVAVSSKEAKVDNGGNDEKKMEESKDQLESAVKTILATAIPAKNEEFVTKLLQNVACVTLQHKIRSQLVSMEAVAFIADGSILPRKSGTSDAPMASPPAVPFLAPPDSPMSQEISISTMGSLAKYLPSSCKQVPSEVNGSIKTVVKLSGMVVPAGITLICGGGYHGKSTLLQTIAVGIYDKIPGDGREFCVAVPDAVSVRAEDGRYVNNCNISAFISNLPTPPGVTKAMDTQHFSTRDSSGSTSQAANVSEAIEMGATAMLVDEDISAANFMARDGRMRALVMDESITPLLYRVNGLYNTHKISSVVVVGGVGDWLDVPHQVILLDKYVASDATKKAQSISYQFSYGHVQYGGRGVVHRLEWEKTGTPFPRRPADSFSQNYSSNVVVSLLDGGHAISLHQEDMNEDDDASDSMSIVNDDDDEGCIEASRLEQLMGRKQLYGCGLCAAWVLQAAPKHPSLSIPQLLNKLDETVDENGMVQILRDVKESNSRSSDLSAIETWKHLVESVGYAQRPRKYEIGQALTRMHGIQMEEIPVEDDGAEEAARLEAERKKKELADLWASRRKK